MPSSQSSHLTVLVHSRGESKSLARLLRGLRRHYPHLPVIAGIPDEQSAPGQQVLPVRLPTGSSEGAAWNALLARVRTPYFLLLDEGHQFIRQTRIDRLVEAIEEENYDLVFGEVAFCRGMRLFPRSVERATHGRFALKKDHLVLYPLDPAPPTETVPCHMGPIFFAARTSRVRAMGGWDPELTAGGSEEFFFRADLYGLRIGCRAEVRIRQWIRQWNVWIAAV